MPNTEETNNEKPILNLLLVGDKEVGKTKLLKRFFSNDYEESYYRTSSVISVAKTIDISGKQVEFHIGDVSSNHESESSDYQNTEAFMLVIDPTKSEADVGKQYKSKMSEIGKYNKPVYIVISKTDHEKCTPEQLIRVKQGLRDLGADEKKIISTSAKTGEGVRGLFEQVAADLINNQQIESAHEQKAQPEIEEKLPRTVRLPRKAYLGLTVSLLMVLGGATMIGIGFYALPVLIVPGIMAALVGASMSYLSYSSQSKFRQLMQEAAEGELAWSKVIKTTLRNFGLASAFIGGVGFVVATILSAGPATALIGSLLLAPAAIALISGVVLTFVSGLSLPSWGKSDELPENEELASSENLQGNAADSLDAKLEEQSDLSPSPLGSQSESKNNQAADPEVTDSPQPD